MSNRQTDAKKSGIGITCVSSFCNDRLCRWRSTADRNCIFCIYMQSTITIIVLVIIIMQIHTSNLSRIPRIYPCKFFLAGVNVYRFNAKNWHFDRFYVKKWLFFTDLTRKIGVFRCKFYSPKILPV